MLQSSENSNQKPIQRVVLVDDDSTDNYLHRRTAERSGLVGQVVSFEHAEDALHYLSQGQPYVDVVCLDINMPRMDGFEFLDAFEKLRFETDRRPLILILSTSIRAEDIQRASEITTRMMTASKPLSQETIQFIADRHFGTARIEQDT